MECLKPLKEEKKIEAYTQRDRRTDVTLWKAWNQESI
jgi:hypothetical protein